MVGGRQRRPAPRAQGLAADDIENQSDSAYVFQVVVVEFDELLRAEVERHLIGRMLFRIHEVLGDVALLPSQVIPSGMWQALHDAFMDPANPESIKYACDASTHLPNKDAHLNLSAVAALEAALRDLLADRLPETHLSLSADLAAQGFSGAQLRFRLLFWISSTPNTWRMVESRKRQSTRRVRGGGSAAASDASCLVRKPPSIALAEPSRQSRR